MKKIELTVQGMHCKSCEMLIKESLEEQDGISSVAISAKDSAAKVEYDDSKISEHTIKSIIRNEGFKVK